MLEDRIDLINRLESSFVYSADDLSPILDSLAVSLPPLHYCFIQLFSVHLFTILAKKKKNVSIPLLFSIYEYTLDGKSHQLWKLLLIQFALVDALNICFYSASVYYLNGSFRYLGMILDVQVYHTACYTSRFYRLL